jgi:hypothetical protein
MKLFALILLALPAFGASVFTLGTNSFANGAAVSSGTFTAASDVAPFNVVHGADTVGPNGSFSFTFTGLPLSGVTSASLVLSLWDLDSAASGNQIASFTLNGSVDLTSAIQTVSEAAAAAQATITYLTINLNAAAITQIQTGTATFAFTFSGPGLGVIGETPTNGGGADFAELTLETGPPVPEPSSLLLASTGLLALLGTRLRKRR